MKKAKHVQDSSGRNPSVLPLSKLEGTVDFSELVITDGGWTNLTLGFKGFDIKVWVRGDHRINVGEKARVHYHPQTLPFVAEAYEILTPNGKQVSYRYHNKGFSFVEEK